MTSTRNNNTLGDYCLQQRQYNSASVYVMNPERRFAHVNTFPCTGVNVGYMPAQNLSYNPVAIETALYGIGSTNLVNPKPPTYPYLKSLPNLAFFSRNGVFMPEPLVVKKNQRPFPIP